MSPFYHLVFNHAPDHEPAQFIELEDGAGRSQRAGEWVTRPDGRVELRLPRPALAAPINPVAVDSTVIGGAAAAGREGFVLVPVEPTWEMIEAGVTEVEYDEISAVDGVRNAWLAMIDAARASTPDADR